MKALAVLAAGVLAGVLFLVLRPEDEPAPSPPPETAASTTETRETTTAEDDDTDTSAGPQLTRINIEVEGGQPVGGIARVEVERGRQVELVVRSDVADEVHLHGYDLFDDVSPGEPARIRFRATIPGRVQAELEERHVSLLDLTVHS
jgi:hypothetical protein